MAPEDQTRFIGRLLRMKEIALRFKWREGVSYIILQNLPSNPEWEKKPWRCFETGSRLIREEWVNREEDRLCSILLNLDLKSSVRRYNVEVDYLVDEGWKSLGFFEASTMRVLEPGEEIQVVNEVERAAEDD